jgi:multidrug efflux pump subunit AcrB
MRSNPHMRQVNQDWGERAPALRFTLDQDRLRLIGLSPNDVAEQLQFLLTGVPVTEVREDIRTVQVIARSAGPERLDPAKLADLVLTSEQGRLIPLSQVGSVNVEPENPILRRRDRTPTITVRGDIDESVQPPQVSREIEEALKPLVAALPSGYRIETGGSIEEAGKANRALVPVFPIMIILTLIVIIFQVRSFSGLAMVVFTAAGAHQPCRPCSLSAAVWLQCHTRANRAVGHLSATLILIGQIKSNKADGLDDYHAVVEATVQRARPVTLKALAAVLAFIPLTTSVFFGSMASTLIGGTAGGTLLTLIFLPALYALWFKVRPREEPAPADLPPAAA